MLKNILKFFSKKQHSSPAQTTSNSKNFDYTFDNNKSIREDIKDKYGFDGDLLDIFVGNKNYLINKWHHYIPIYDRYFSSYRGKKVRLLEIGVSKGGSLQMWRKYFGNEAIIYGIDIDADCKKYDGLSAQVRIGSQTDPEFLKTVIEEMGGVDIILDDGSHQMDHVPVSLKCLYPFLSYGGIYMIEDLHTAYWESFGGGYQSQKNFFSFVNDIVDDMHRWYHMHEAKQSDISDNCTGVHIHDSIVVFEKNKVYKPVSSLVV